MATNGTKALLVSIVGLQIYFSKQVNYKIEFVNREVKLYMKKQWIDIGHHTAREEREQVNKLTS